MSNIAASEQYDVVNLRKAIDYFSHLAIVPEFFSQLKESDKDFVETDYFPKMIWLKYDREDLHLLRNFVILLFFVH